MLYIDEMAKNPKRKCKFNRFHLKKLSSGLNKLTTLKYLLVCIY